MILKRYRWYIVGGITFIGWTTLVFLGLETLVFMTQTH
jgi:hypothetical protein